MSANSLQIDFERAAGSLVLHVAFDANELQAFTDYCDAMGRKLSRKELLPILLEHMKPLAASERSFLEDHTISGALALSLQARSGSGDRPGTISAFSAPTATVKQLRSRWSGGRKQQRKWAAGLADASGRRVVFYGPIVHQGHRIVKRGKDGQLYDTGKTVAPIPFAQQAVDSMGDEQAEAAGQDILDYVFGED